VEEFLKLVGATAAVILGVVIIAVATWKHIREVFRFLYDPQKLILKEYGDLLDHIITETCNRLGLTGHEDRFRAIRLVDESGLELPEWTSEYRDRFHEIVKQKMRHVPAEVGTRQKHHYNYYVDLRSAITDASIADDLGYILVTFMREAINNNRIAFDYIACNRSGSTILGYFASTRFKVPLLLVSKTSRWRIQGQDIFIDGHYSHRPSQRAEVVLIDDSCSNGTALLEAANRLRDAGLTVHHAFVLFNRIEAQAPERLAEAGIRLHSIMSVSDEDLRDLMSLPAAEVSSPIQLNQSMEEIFPAVPFPLHRLNLYINLICPLRCKHCCVGPQLDGMQMTRDEISRYLRMAHRPTSPEQIMLLGGEPSLHPHLADILEMASQHKTSELSLCTSGFEYTRISPLLRYLHHINVSLDGFSQSSHDAVRRNGSYETALEAIRAFVKGGMQVKILFTVNSSNIAEIRQGLPQMAALGINEINFHVISDNGFAKKNANLLLKPSDWHAMRKWLDDYDGPLTIKYPLKYVTAEELVTERKANYKCMLSNANRLNIMPGGKCFSCCLFLDTDLPIGHINADGFSLSRASEQTIYLGKEHDTCVAEHSLLGYKDTQLTPLCVHWKRQRGAAVAHMK
jgi:MoaA/NifB/PqqE/SkfB family radical SAM enzyme/orotate phosphoribosyltransferase